MKRSILVLALLLAPALVAAQNAPRIPTVDDLLRVKAAGSPQISPDGAWVVYTVSDADFVQDAFVSQIWLVNAATGDRRQLTRGEKPATNPQWSPDGQWIAFTSSRIGDRNQLFAMRADGGEAVQLTKAETAVGAFAWSPDGTRIAFSATEPATQLAKDRRAAFSDFEVVRQEYDHAHLWTIDVDEAIRTPVTGRQQTRGKEFSVAGFTWSPDARRIAFSATVNPDLIQGVTADVFVLTLAGDSVRRLVSLPGPDSDPHWSPDGSQIVFSTYMGKVDYFARNSRLAVVPAAGGTPRALTDAFDENPSLVAWNRDGIYFTGSQKTASHLFRIAPAGGAIARVSAPDNAMTGSYSLSRDGRRAALIVNAPMALPEVAVSEVSNWSPKLVTDMSAQAKGLITGTREVIEWKSKDGTIIEGVLIKPANFDPARKYPLLCVIHGGPTAIDRPTFLDTRYYPVDSWVARGALVLKVNYRGSTGYGEKFRRLNVRNLGVGDAWDVISGVDYLIGKGWVDPARVASMGWSQGGYISAFLTTSSTRFKAISVGAGISDWATYYYNTDITPFTINYLGANPVDDPEVYRKTSPFSYVKEARTPTLIQHGELDRRVPIANAYQLRQALADRGVPVEMVVYKGFGHGITKPRAMRAVMEHNLVWFNHYLWGDAKPDLAAPPLPQKDTPTAR
jgi:dipeptidyl aminopeptidase/acylaminoacyl peptidase